MVKGRSRKTTIVEIPDFSINGTSITKIFDPPLIILTKPLIEGSQFESRAYYKFYNDTYSELHSLKVLSKETVKVKAGKFDTQKILWSYTDSNGIIHSSLWYFYPQTGFIKIETFDGTTLELKSYNLQ